MPSMRISIAKDEQGEPCHGTVPQVSGRDGKVGCFEECFTPDITTGSITGDYLLIPGGKYTDNTAPAPAKMYNNDYYCGEGLANIENRVSVETPGPVIVRSQHCIS